MIAFVLRGSELEEGKCWAFKSDGVGVSPSDQTHEILPSRYALIAPSSYAPVNSTHPIALFASSPPPPFLADISAISLDMTVWPRQKPETYFDRKLGWQVSCSKNLMKKLMKKRAVGQHGPDTVQHYATRIIP
jgi:hypothetical protein